jgi:hypothetical protein
LRFWEANRKIVCSRVSTESIVKEQSSMEAWSGGVRGTARRRIGSERPRR